VLRFALSWWGERYGEKTHPNGWWGTDRPMSRSAKEKKAANPLNSSKAAGGGRIVGPRWRYYAFAREGIGFLDGMVL